MTATKKPLSILLAFVMLVSMFANIIVPVYAAEDVGTLYLVQYPRGGGDSDAWGHPNLTYMNGWESGSATGFITRSTGSYTGQLVYCIEPGVAQNTGDTVKNKGEDFWENYPDSLNPTIDPDTIKTHIGRILQYGYTGNNTTTWDVDNASDQNTLAQIIATQILIWETIVGERDDDFEHVSAHTKGYDEVFDTVSDNHPLRSKILSAYNSIVSSVQNHDTIPSFMSRSRGSAQTYEMEWNGSQYVLELKDTNGVLKDFTFSSPTSGVKVSQSGNTLTITASEVPSDSIVISAVKGTQRMGVVVWTDGVASSSQSGQIQDTVTWGERVSDPVNAYLNIKVSYGEAKIVKHSEDGKISGVRFQITGNGIDETVTTGTDGSITVSNLKPGDYTVTELSDNRYEPQEPQTVTVVSGRTAVVTFSNTLKRGSLKVTKSSEDKLVEGVEFHLYGTSLSGLAVDEYAFTDENGVAYFEDILISGDTAYILEEVDTADRYVVPDDQEAVIYWNEVTERSFSNILKKFRVEVSKVDAETGSAQGDASLAGAKYGLYDGDELVAEYTTDSNGSFVTDYFICGDNWTLRELSPSGGYLLDGTVYEIPADASSFEIELNELSEKVLEEVIKGNIRLVKHIDKPDPDVQEDAEATAIEASVETASVEETISQTESTEAEAITDPAAEQVEGTEEIAVATESDAELAETVSDGDAQPASAEETAPETSLEETEEAVAETEAPSEIEETVPETEASADAEEQIGDQAEEIVPEQDASGETEAETALEVELDQPEQVPEENIEASGGHGVVEQPEEGAKFQIYLASAGSYDAASESERDILVTDSDGFAYSKDLPYGRYCVHQIEGMEGQAFVDDFTVFICEDGQTYSYILNNQTTSSFIRVEKRDAESGNIIAAANIGFQVRDLSTGELISQNVYYPTPVTITTFYTNDEGWLMLPCELDYGQYELIEVQTCYGYVLDSEPVPFTVDGSSDVVTVEKYNYAQKGVIKIQKTGEVFVSVSQQDDFYQPVYEVQGLAGAVFTITAAEDIVTLDGTVRYTKGELVDTITTGSDGWAVSKELYLGKFIVTEIEAPEPMVVNSEPQTVELVYAGQDVELTEISAGCFNERQKVQICMAKTMEKDSIFNIGYNDEVTSVTFGLYAAEDILAADGSVIPADGLIEIVSVAADGSAYCNSDLPLGSYYLQERTTNGNYILDDTKYPVTFSYAGQEAAKIYITVNDGDAIVNELIYGSVSGKKVDDSGNALGGAVIGLFATDEGEFTEETAILTTTSAEDGSFRFDNVPKGTWYIREIQQPEGFVLCADIFPVEISEDEQVVEIEIMNKRIRGNLSLTKIDEDYPDHKLTGAEFEVYRDVNDNQELDKDDELLGLMEEVDTGFYEMKDIEFGGVLVREKTAPEGFYLDENVYYISIESDSETYVVENEAGIGFINQAHRGNLKIVKTSSDGKVEGFTFRITGEDYDRTFTTGSDGVILIEDLRVGKYTVTELEDEMSADYKRPDPVTVELVTGETLTVNVHNEKVTVDVPKTGDESNMRLWIGLLGLSAAGAGTLIFVEYKKRKKNIKK